MTLFGVVGGAPRDGSAFDLKSVTGILDFLLECDGTVDKILQIKDFFTEENKSKPTSNSTLKAIFDKKYIINKLEYSDGSPSKMDTLEYESTDKNGNSTYKMGKQTKKDIDNGIYPK